LHAQKWEKTAGAKIILASNKKEYHSYKFHWRRFLQLLSLTYVNIYCLDHSFYTLLATGYFGFDTLSCFLVACAAIQVTWYSGRRSF
jgi:hypothetical protein